MCGIIGSVSKDLTKETFIAARDIISHRGPDDAGYFEDSATGVKLGHRRLSILDLSSSGHQPMKSNDGRYVLVFNGEIYNYLELKSELTGYDFKSTSDTEVVLAAYCKWGDDCVKHFNGMFAISIYDLSTKRITLFRDRLGIKPLYYVVRGGELCFASEMKGLFRMGVERKPNYDAIRDYLVLGYYDHTEETFFDGIRQFPAGSYGVFHEGRLKVEVYWDPSKDGIDSIRDNTQAIEEYMSLLDNAVEIRMRTDVPYAVMLSGGLDSSVLADTASRHVSGHPLNVMTFRHNDSRYDEGGWADLVSAGRDWASSSVTVTEDKVAAMMEKAIWHQEEPFGGVATMADMLLAEKARSKGVYVLLEGQGADETLGGYEYYYAYYLADMAAQDSGAAKSLHRQYASLRGISGSEIDASYAELLAKGSNISGIMGQDGTRVGGKKGLAADLVNHKVSGYREPDFLASRFENALYRDLFQTKVPRVLRFKDKASMMFGVELRVPFLDHRLVELSFSIPSEEKLKNGLTKFCLRSQFKGRLPDQTVMHVKRQVQTPQREWLRTSMKSYVLDTIESDSFSSRGVFDPVTVRKLFSEYVEFPEKYPNGFFVWQWVMVERWFEAFIDRDPGERASSVS